MIENFIPHKNDMYLAKIEEYFFKYRRQGTILSPQNWVIAERWEQMGIPLHIVCKGIKETCRKFRSTHHEGLERIDMLTYCEPEILKLWKEHRKALLGAPEKPKKDKNSESLSDIITQRISYIRESLINAAGGSGAPEDLKSMALARTDWKNELDAILREYCRNDQQIDIESIERRLSILDQAYIGNLLALLSEQEKKRWMQEIETELSTYKEQMDKDSYQQTLEMGMESLLRERLHVRRISLYAT